MVKLCEAEDKSCAAGDVAPWQQVEYAASEFVTSIIIGYAKDNAFPSI